MWPFCLSKPSGNSRRGKKRKVQTLTEAIAEAYDIDDTPIFLLQYAAEDVAMGRRLQSENIGPWGRASKHQGAVCPAERF